MKLSLFIVLLVIIGCFLGADGVTKKSRSRYASKCLSFTILGQTWSEISYAAGATDNKTASVIVFQHLSPQLYCSNFTIGLPSYAIVSEVEVVITRFSRMIPSFDPQTEPLTDAQLQIRSEPLSDGLLSLYPYTPWTEEAAAVKFGGTLDLWEGGDVWVPDVAQINAINFGVSLTVAPTTINSTAHVDSVLLRITWIEKECGDQEITGDEQCEINGVGCASNCTCLSGYVPTFPSTKDCILSCGDNSTYSDPAECHAPSDDPISSTQPALPTSIAVPNCSITTHPPFIGYHFVILSLVLNVSKLLTTKKSD